MRPRKTPAAGETGLTLLQLDQPEAAVLEHQDGDGQAVVAQRPELAHHHLEPAVAHHRDHAAGRARRRLAPIASGRAAPIVHQPADCSSASGRRARQRWLSRMRWAPLSTVTMADGGQRRLQRVDDRVRAPGRGRREQLVAVAGALGAAPQAHDRAGASAAATASSVAASGAGDLLVDPVHAMVAGASASSNTSAEAGNGVEPARSASRSGRSRRAGRVGPADEVEQHAVGQRRQAGRAERQGMGLVDQPLGLVGRERPGMPAPRRGASRGAGAGARGLEAGDDHRPLGGGEAAASAGDGRVVRVRARRLRAVPRGCGGGAARPRLAATRGRGRDGPAPWAASWRGATARPTIAAAPSGSTSKLALTSRAGARHGRGPGACSGRGCGRSTTPETTSSGIRSCTASAMPLTALARPGPSVVTSRPGAPVKSEVAGGRDGGRRLVAGEDEARCRPARAHRPA